MYKLLSLSLTGSSSLSSIPSRHQIVFSNLMFRSEDWVIGVFKKLETVVQILMKYTRLSKSTFFLVITTMKHTEWKLRLHSHWTELRFHSQHFEKLCQLPWPQVVTIRNQGRHFNFFSGGARGENILPPSKKWTFTPPSIFFTYIFRPFICKNMSKMLMQIWLTVNYQL